MNLPVVLTRSFGRSVLKFKKDSPHIFFVAGVIGSVTSTVLACRATLKLSDELDEIQKDLSEVKALKSSVYHSNSALMEKTYSQEDYKKDLGYVYIKSGLRLTKLYAPAVLVGAASIAALTGSHVQMSRRNAALMAAYAAVQKAYDDYRERVREQMGEDKELEVYHAVKIEEKAPFADPTKWSPYARFFDEYSKNWEKDPEYNRLFVQCQQNYANQLLKSRGHVFLNEVYDMLGLDRSSAGAIVGWVNNKDSDNFIDFGMFEAYNARFISGIERSVLLDFNVDGVIYDKI